MPVETEELHEQAVLDAAEQILRQAQTSHDGPPPPDLPDDGYRRERPEKPTWGWLNTLGIVLATGGFVEFWRSTNGLQAGLSYAAMLAGVMLIEKRRHSQ